MIYTVKYVRICEEERKVVLQLETKEKAKILNLPTNFIKKKQGLFGWIRPSVTNSSYR